MIVADGRMANVLPDILDGEEIGTLFIPAARKLLQPQPLDRRRPRRPARSRRRWGGESGRRKK